MVEILKSLVGSYKRQFQLMGDSSLEDDERQKRLISLVKEQLVGLGKLILSIALFVAPFASLFLLQYVDADLDPSILVSWWGILIPIVTVILYIQVKKRYGNLFGIR
jgi:hypothetical protein